MVEYEGRSDILEGLIQPTDELRGVGKCCKTYSVSCGTDFMKAEKLFDKSVFQPPQWRELTR